MARVALLLEYSGRSLHGSQLQLGVRTVQSELEKALTTVLRRETRAIFSGRTDSGVHAAGQVAHIDILAEELDIRNFCWSLNGLLDNDIAVRTAQIVPADFHARYTAIRREYVYRLLNRRQRSALLKDDHHFVFTDLDLNAMQQAALELIGSHDFTSFRSTSADRTTSICQVSRAELLNKGEGKLEFWIAANHFVYNMVRIIVGTLIEIGLGKKAPESFVKALSESDRNLAGPTAPPWGLTLNSIEYPEHYKLFEEAHKS